MYISATELPNFIRKYYLLHELLISKYWQQNISVSDITLHTAVQSGTQVSSPQGTWDSASVNSWNTRLHYSSSVVLTLTQSTTSSYVTELANIRIRQMWISCAKSVGFGCGCGCGFVMRSKLPATIVTVIQLSYLKLSSCKWTSSEQLK